MFNIEQDNKGEWFLTWGGVAFPQTPLATRELAESRLRRMKNRYPFETFQLILDSVPQRATVGWRWTLGDQSEVIITKTKADAKSVLRYQLQRKALPAGMTWEAAYDTG